AIAHFVRNAGNDVCLTNTISLRSRMMRKYQVRFWRATALVRESLTLILREEGINILSANTVGQTEFQAGGEQVRLVSASTKKRCSKKQESPVIAIA
ncbi:hypothetical protein ACE1CI_22415, partial [Aerosakkonemataceae cyanobacterium BLCC-F50]